MSNDVGREPGPTPQAGIALSAADMAALVAMAGRAPSIHNTQPWKFRHSGDAIELFSDDSRKLRHVDPTGRELVISCGAALFGLRLGLRKLGYLPRTELLPDPDRPDLLARVKLAGTAPITRDEAELAAAVPHRHTHRGNFSSAMVPERLLAGLRLDALLERAELVIVDRPGTVRELAGLTLAAAQEQAADPVIAAELRNWVRPAGELARDGVPAHAIVANAGSSEQLDQDCRDARPAVRGMPVSPRLPGRDFGQPGLQSPGGPPPAVTAVLMTPDDRPADWVRAGQALHRLLLRAASRWVFATMQSQPLEVPALRAEVRQCLDLSGQPQLLLQLGRANVAAATARRPVAETLVSQ